MAKNIPGQVKVTTIYLENELQEGGHDKLKLFRCYNCGAPMLEYKGNIKTIIPGGFEYEPYTLLKCKGSVRNDNGNWEQCGMKYIFGSTVYTVNPKLTE